MNRYEQQSCLTILDILSSNPIYKMFELPPDSETRIPVYFNFIHEKVENGIYSSKFDFITDVRILFKNAKDSKSGDIFYRTGAALLSEKFENCLSKGYIVQNKNESNLFKMSQFFETKLAQYHPHTKLTHEEKIKDEPAATIIQEGIPEEIKISDISTSFRILKNLQSIISATTHLADLQKNTVTFGNQLSINTPIIEPATQKELYEFLLKLLKEQAQTNHINYF